VASIVAKNNLAQRSVGWRIQSGGRSIDYVCTVFLEDRSKDRTVILPFIFAITSDWKVGGAG